VKDRGLIKRLCLSFAEQLLIQRVGLRQPALPLQRVHQSAARFFGEGVVLAEQLPARHQRPPQ
jgi:hypothetical protein